MRDPGTTPDPSSEDDVREIERLVLSSLLGGDTLLKKRARELLARYGWSEDAHRALFDIITSLPITSRQVLRDQLLSRMTRCGFPDFDFDRLFGYPAVGTSESEKWILRLSEKKRGS